VLSELADEWTREVGGWRAMNKADGVHPNDEYLLYQTLIGAWPSLPDARSDYFDPAPLKKSPPARAKLQCLWFDGAGVTIERLRDGKLEVGSARYGSRDDSFCPHECCDPLSRPISRFFDQLAQLVKCERDVTSGGT